MKHKMKCLFCLFVVACLQRRIFTQGLSTTSQGSFPESASRDLHLNHLFSGSRSNYYVSSKRLDVISAQETCKSSKKSLNLLSVENEEEFHEILSHLDKKLGVDEIWTSGMETIFQDSRNFLWTSTALPFDYTNFATTLSFLVDGNGPGRQKRGVHGANLVCNCNHECTERPSCQHVNCTVTGETCAVEQPTCSEPVSEECYLIEPQPTCTVTCPDCTLQRGSCVLIQPVCKVKDGTPSCRTTQQGNCTLIPPVYEVIPGKCSLIQEPCAVIQPTKPCDRPTNCTFQYNPNPNCGFGGGPLFGDSKSRLQNKTQNCHLCPNQGNCTNECPTNDNCFQVFNCVPDRICQAPPVICPPPIHHCLPAQLVEISPEALQCDEPETTCDPPVLECTEVQKKCEEDVITCPSPQTICTPAVSHCPRPNYSCSQPLVDCERPSVDCPQLPECQIPPSCYGNQGYRPITNGCNCRGKRDIVDKGPLIAAKCVVLKKTYGYKWALEECRRRNYFICEESHGH